VNHGSRCARGSRSDIRGTSRQERIGIRVAIAQHVLALCEQLRIVGFFEFGEGALQAHDALLLVDRHNHVAFSGDTVFVILRHRLLLQNFCSLSLPHALPTLQSHGIGIGGVKPQASL